MNNCVPILMLILEIQDPQLNLRNAIPAEGCSSVSVATQGQAKLVIEDSKRQVILQQVVDLPSHGIEETISKPEILVQAVSSKPPQIFSVKVNSRSLQPDQDYHLLIEHSDGNRTHPALLKMPKRGSK